MLGFGQVFPPSQVRHSLLMCEVLQGNPHFHSGNSDITGLTSAKEVVGVPLNQ